MAFANEAERQRHGKGDEDLRQERRLHVGKIEIDDIDRQHGESHTETMRERGNNREIRKAECNER